MEKLLSILEAINDSIDFTNQTALVDDEVIDSLELMELISELEEAYDISIEMEDIIPQNFNSVEAILALIERLS